MSRTLVTGASGFIGGAVVAALAAAGHEVRAARRPAMPRRRHDADVSLANVEWMTHGDLETGIDWCPLVAGVDFIVHLAGIAHADAAFAPAGPAFAAAATAGAACPQRGEAPFDRPARDSEEARYDRVNHRATSDLAHAAAAAGVRRLVFVSSVRAQSGPASDRVLTEADLPRPVDAYGRSKLAAEYAVARSGVPFTILRPVLVYAAGAKGNLRALLRLAALPVPLPFGAFTNRRSLLGLPNLVAAIAHVLQHEASRGETYLAADPRPLSLAEIIAALRCGIGRKPGLIAIPPAAIRAGLAALGRGDRWDQLGGSLIADPAKLIAAGWRPDADTAGALAALMRQA